MRASSLAVALLVAVLGCEGDPGQDGDPGDQGDQGDQGDKGDQGDPGGDGANYLWEMSATDGLIIGGYGDNFSYDGTDVVAMAGANSLELAVDEAINKGYLVAQFTGTLEPDSGGTQTGNWAIVMDVFTPYNDANAFPPFFDGGVAANINIHGDTGKGPPVMPEVTAFLVGWGIADVYLDGALVYEDQFAHFMYTDDARDDTTNAVYKADQTTPYSPGTSSDGYVDATGREMHLVVHSYVADSSNFPPHDMWIHLNFKTISELIAPAGAAM